MAISSKSLLQVATSLACLLMLFLLLHPLFSALSRQLLLLPLLAHTSNSLTEVAHYLLQRKVHKVATKNAHRLPTFNVQRSPLVFTGIAHTPRCTKGGNLLFRGVNERLSQVSPSSRAPNKS